MSPKKQNYVFEKASSSVRAVNKKEEEWREHAGAVKVWRSSEEEKENEVVLLFHANAQGRSFAWRRTLKFPVCWW